LENHNLTRDLHSELRGFGLGYSSVVELSLHEVGYNGSYL
jgi:hypothetical protein